MVWLLLPVLGGCGCLGQSGGSAVPPPEQRSEGGLLLRTGSIQLGPGYGENAYPWQPGTGPRFFYSGGGGGGGGFGGGGFGGGFGSMP
jgi:hypothetical protein